MVKFKKQGWYSVSIYNNTITRDYIVAELDKRKIYEITYNNGKKDLVSIINQELRGVYGFSLLTRGHLIMQDFVKMYEQGKIKETDYVVQEFENQIIERN